MIRSISFPKLGFHFPFKMKDSQAVAAACIGNRVFSSTKMNGDAPSALLTKKIEAETSKIHVQINSKERLPFAVWQKVHSSLVPNDFSWNNKARRWEAAITPMSKQASDEMVAYAEEVKSSIGKLQLEEKEQMDNKWVKDEDAYIAKWYPEEHKKIQSKIQTESVSKVEPSRLIEEILEEAKDFIPHGTDKKRFIASLKETLESIDRLEQFDSSSVRKAALTASALGLYPSLFLQQCYFLPFKESLHFVIGYRGLIELSLRSGDVSFYEAKCVYEKDSFETKNEGIPRIWHRPYEDIKNRGKISAIYAIRVMKNGQKDVVALSTKDIKNIKRNKDNVHSPWGAWTEEMYTKTVIKILAKQSELSTETPRSQSE